MESVGGANGCNFIIVNFGKGGLNGWEMKKEHPLSTCSEGQGDE